ncbi:hypothetical protein [Streptomyces sp. NPDC002990]
MPAVPHPSPSGAAPRPPAAQGDPLHDAYVAKINAAVAAGRDDLVAELAAAYEREAGGRAGEPRSSLP